MASVFPGSRSFSSALALPGGRQLARGMSRHIAGAMLGFALWQMWLAAAFMQAHGGAVLPWAALGLLVLFAVPLARRLERRWQRLAADALPCHGLLSRYRRDRALLWTFALLVPPVWIGMVLLAARLTPLF
jgi:hypothetical protein